MKRTLCMLLTLAMLMSCLPMAAFAEETEVTATAETETAAEAAPAAQTVPAVNLTGTLEGICLKSAEILMTASGISAYALDDYGNPVLAGGNYARWYDRLGTKPAYAANFYLWLEEATDGDGMEDQLINVENAPQNEFGYVHTIASFNETVYVDLPYDVDENTLLGACGEAAGTAMGLNLGEAASYMMAVYNAFDRDHPEVFWLSGRHMVGTPSTTFDIGYNGTQWEVSFIQEVCFILKTVEFDVRSDKYPTASAINAGIARRDSAVNNILAGISASASNYDKVVYLNDWLTRNNAYNSSPNLNAIDTNCRKCLSGLFGSTGINGPVCEGYARAFKVLCDKLGIGCVLVDGDANNGVSTEAHMWNYVQMDNGKWYAVDVTWNDPVVSGASGAVSGYECQDYLLVGAYTIVDDMPFINSHPVSNTVSDGGVAFTNGPVLAAEKYGTDEPCQHTYDAPIFTWTEYEDCSASFTCTDCGDTQTVTCFITSQTTPATATQDGQTVYTATAAFGSDEFYDTQTKILPALGGQKGIIDQGTLADGKCSWKLDSNGVLTISGNGDMYVCQMQTQVPWLSHADQIKKAVIEEGVTSIGPFSFYKCLNLAEVSIADSVKQIHQDAFYWCRSLTEVTIPDAVISIGTRAFYNCDGLESIDLGQGVQILGNTAFDMCRGLAEITIPASVVAIEPYCFRSCENLSKVTFQGNAPTFSGQVFSGVGIFPSDTLTCCYPANNSTWTEAVMQNYGGSVNWVAVDENGEVEETNPSGKCGDNLTWELDLTTGVLTISGTGAMNKVDSMIYSPWYGYKDQIKKVVIEEGVTTVGKCMLSGLPNMAEVVLPDSLWYIEDAAFEMSGLTAIDLSSVGAVENAAFHGCEKLTEVTIPDGIELRGYDGPTNSDVGIFSHCTNLKKVTVGNFTDSGFNLFRNCTSLTDVTLLEGMEFLSGHMFDGCTALTEITIPNGTDIGGAAFSGCTALDTVNFGTSVGLVGERSFENCTSLKRIDFPWVVGELYDSVCYGSGVNTLYFKGDAPSFSRHTLNNLKVTIYYPSGNSTWTDKVNGHFGANIDTWVPYAVSHTHSYGSWTTVTPSTCAVKGEEERKCAICGAVETRELPLKEHSYTETVTPPTCTEQGWTTYSCTVCDYSYMDTEISALGHDYWNGICTRCGEAEPVHVHSFDGMTHQCACGVYGGVCGDNLTWTLTNGVLTVHGTGAMDFYDYMEYPWIDYCESIINIVIENGVTRISTYAFSNCINLQNVIIPESVQIISPNVFSNCRNLSSITIPRNVTYIGEYAFDACSSLEGIWVDEQNTAFSNDEFGALFDKEKTKIIEVPETITGEYSIPNSVTEIFDAFDGCSQLTSVSIPDGVGLIRDLAFYECSSLTSVSIPDGVRSIGEAAFSGCSSLTTIFFNGDAPSFGVNIFYGVTATASYPANNLTWTEDVMQDYGGTITWVPYGEHTHSFMNYVNNNDATCTADGTKTAKCEHCDVTETVADTGSARGHSWDGGTITTQPTETTEGVRTYTCTVCRETKTESIPVLDHIQDNDSEKQLMRVTAVDADGETREYSFTYDDRGRLISSLLTESQDSGAPKEYAYSYDENNRLTTVQVVGDHWLAGTVCAEYYYDEKGFLVRSIARDGGAVEYLYQYDEQGRLGQMETIADIGTWITDYTYSADGLEAQAVTHAPYGETYNYYTFDIKGRVLTDRYITDGYSCLYQYDYGYEPFVYATVKEENNTWHDIYLTDIMGERTWSLYVGEQISLEKDADGYLSKIINSEGTVFEIHYHIHDYDSAVTAPTCTEGGYTTYTCACGDSYTDDEVPATGHTEVTDAAVAPTCTETGLTEGKHCSVCGEILTAQETVAATGHSWDAGVITTQPTETTEGVRTYTCTVCGETKTESVPVLDHVHSYTSSMTAATCTEKGTERRDCTRCDHYETRDIAAKGHTEVIDPAVSATCTTEGKTEGKHCSVCSVVLKEQETVPTTGHSWDMGQVTTAPTATTPGVKTYICTACGETETEAIPATGETILWGDVNGDGWVDSFDASLIMKYDVMLIGDSDLDLTAADVSGDGWVDSYDASLILKYDVFLIEKFPVEE